MKPFASPCLLVASLVIAAGCKHSPAHADDLRASESTQNASVVRLPETPPRDGKYSWDYFAVAVHCIGKSNDELVKKLGPPGSVSARYGGLGGFEGFTTYIYSDPTGGLLFGNHGDFFFAVLIDDHNIVKGVAAKATQADYGDTRISFIRPVWAMLMGDDAIPDGAYDYSNSVKNGYLVTAKDSNGVSLRIACEAAEPPTLTTKTFDTARNDYIYSHPKSDHFSWNYGKIRFAFAGVQVPQRSEWQDPGPDATGLTLLERPGPPRR
jgi:hypothetical protein